jgi:hypothetical protein
MTTEKEWWFDDLLPAFSEDYAPDKPYLKECIKKIVKEQKKRDWEEFREMIQEYVFNCDNGDEHASEINKLIEAKLAELNKPKE